ncbi:hypothetical protein N7G274_002094 [Stereocaulon virgatum]|uniref:CST complex subunit Ten1 n=1 Tax=Stereocaulon virgatum TaxID=373712 RepID=A0ABR4ALV8_9LECA
MSNGPLPTTLTFLTLLPTHTAGAKVRFLGCVTHYTLRTGILELQHAYLPSSSHKRVLALVDVNLLLETLKREDTQVGAWVNIIGYVEGLVKEGKTREKDVEEGSDEGPTYMRVQAIMLWSAGGVNIGEYERALEERLKVGGGR